MKSVRVRDRGIALWLCRCALILAAAMPAAAAELSIKGNLRPPACILTLVQGGTGDLGQLRAGNLHPSQPTHHEIPIPMSVDCATPTKVALRAVDNRAGTTVGDLDRYLPAPYYFGLGESGAGKAGDYHIYLGGWMLLHGPKPNPTGDGQTIYPITDNGSTDAWVYYNWGAPFMADGSSLQAFSTHTSPALPAAFSRVSSELTLSIFLNRSSALDLTRETRIDGSATLELVYL